MTPVLSPEQKQAIEQAQGVPIEVLDPAQNATYFLVPAVMFERLIATLDLGEPSEAERIAQLQAFGRAAGWEDPEAAVFDNLKPQ